MPNVSSSKKLINSMRQAPDLERLLCYQEGDLTKTNINMVSCKDSPRLFKYYEKMCTLPS